MRDDSDSKRTRNSKEKFFISIDESESTASIFSKTIYFVLYFCYSRVR